MYQESGGMPGGMSGGMPDGIPSGFMGEGMSGRMPGSFGGDSSSVNKGPTIEEGCDPNCTCLKAGLRLEVKTALAV
ncbi:unnamed protein product [Hymenolepis diminuta]|uniref:Tes101 n=1 Tax=Hymenolepis diminuta TaxID=6216 RepID=A0A0R3SCM3_HYMDI|nr:unnamed protein product [Hymenolepis diminuta]